MVWKVLTSPVSIATEIRALASVMYGPFWQEPEAAASLNFTERVFFVPAEKTAAFLGSVVFTSGDWYGQKIADSLVVGFALTSTNVELLRDRKSTRLNS